MRIMRLLVMFDLPTKTKSNKDAYIKFRRFLEDNGYIREQNSIYSRNLLSRASAETHTEQLRKNLPPAVMSWRCSSPRSSTLTGKSLSIPESRTPVAMRHPERSSS